MIRWVYYPKSRKAPTVVRQVVAVFETSASDIASEGHLMSSNEVLAILEPGLRELGFYVETGKRKDQKIHVPVLFGLNGQLEKYFEADAYQSESGMVLEVEAGRGVVNNQFLKDLFQACMMHEVTEFGVAVRNHYRGSNDFGRVMRFFDTLYASNRLQLPLDGVLLIGY